MITTLIKMIALYNLLAVRSFNVAEYAVTIGGCDDCVEDCMQDGYTTNSPDACYALCEEAC